MDRVCLLEDDPTISELITKKLISRGYEVAHFDTADEVNIAADLYILDVLLPGKLSGLDFCEHLKSKRPETPVLLLSALSEPADRIQGLKVGADDYLTKPFEMEELLLRVQGMLKRRSWYATHPKNQSFFEWGDNNRIDFVSYEARSGNKRFVLTQKECMLMKLLIEKENEVVSRDVILDQVWGYNVFPSSRTVDNFIVRLRKCFEKISSEPQYIHSIRGLGYKFTRNPQEGISK
jgi:two-component system, OmpR family, alkaline phosphatase synthesis response regulator PhoP